MNSLWRPVGAQRDHRIEARSPMRRTERREEVTGAERQPQAQLPAAPAQPCSSPTGPRCSSRLTRCCRRSCPTFLRRDVARPTVRRRLARHHGAELAAAFSGAGRNLRPARRAGEHILVCHQRAEPAAGAGQRRRIASGMGDCWSRRGARGRVRCAVASRPVRPASATRRLKHRLTLRMDCELTVNRPRLSLRAWPVTHLI